MDEQEKKDKNEKHSLMDFTKMEEMVNHVIATDSSLRSFGLRKEHYWIHLSADQDAIMRVQPGHIVKIWLRWPEAFVDLARLIKDAFRAIQKHNLRRSMEVVPYMIVQLEKRKWHKELFTDESEIITDLIPKTRLKVTHKVITIMTDVQTGESIESEIQMIDEMKLRIELSRIVRAKFPPLSLDDDSQAAS